MPKCLVKGCERSDLQPACFGGVAVTLCPDHSLAASRGALSEGSTEKWSPGLPGGVCQRS